MEQLDLFSTKPPDRVAGNISDERKAFDIIYPELCDLIDNSPIDSGVLIFKEINNCSSVYFLSSNMLFFQIRFRKKSRFLLLPEEFKDCLPDNTPIIKVKSDAGMMRISLSDPNDILQYASTLRTMLSMLSRKYHEFDCCSRYEACSNAKACIHPNIKFALGCRYRYNLMDGKIFYGKNKNI